VRSLSGEAGYRFCRTSLRGKDGKVAAGSRIEVHTVAEVLRGRWIANGAENRGDGERKVPAKPRRCIWGASPGSHPCAGDAPCRSWGSAWGGRRGAAVSYRVDQRKSYIESICLRGGSRPFLVIYDGLDLTRLRTFYPLLEFPDDRQNTSASHMAYVCVAQHNMRCSPLSRSVSYRLHNFLRCSYLCWPGCGDLSYATSQTVSAHPQRLIHRDACAIFFAVH
jgi:hypothetical protein